MDNRHYNKYISDRAKKSPTLKNCIKAFFTGGMICLFGEALSYLYSYLGADGDTSPLLALLSIILVTGILTGAGIFDKIAKFGGGGALVPISGFANAMASTAIDAKPEGLITGTAAKLFSIAGPVVVYGTAASVIYGLIYYAIVM